MEIVRRIVDGTAAGFTKFLEAVPAEECCGASTQIGDRFASATWPDYRRQVALPDEQFRMGNDELSSHGLVLALSMLLSLPSRPTRSRRASHAADSAAHRPRSATGEGMPRGSQGGRVMGSAVSSAKCA